MSLYVSIIKQYNIIWFDYFTLLLKRIEPIDVVPNSVVTAVVMMVVAIGNNIMINDAANVASPSTLCPTVKLRE